MKLQKRKKGRAKYIVESTRYNRNFTERITTVHVYIYKKNAIRKYWAEWRSRRIGRVTIALIMEQDFGDADGGDGYDPKDFDPETMVGAPSRRLTGKDVLYDWGN